MDRRLIMFVGDTHGDLDHWDAVLYAAVNANVDAIVQVGDFGYAEHHNEGVQFLSTLNAKLPCPLYWIDGNHDNTPLLWNHYRLGQVGGFITMRDKITYISRGTAWTWGSTILMGMGGGFSVDYQWRLKLMREKNIDLWWSTEEITDEDLERARQSSTFLPPDILITHDAPDGAPIETLGQIKNLESSVQTKSMLHRMKVRRLVEMTNPRLLVHGHYHEPLEYDLDYTRTHCVSLGDNRSQNISDSYMIVDLMDFDLEYPQ